MRKSIHFLLAKVPHIDVPPELRAHNLAVKFPLPGVEQGLINILVGMAQFAEGHSIKFDATITKDGVLGPVWVTMARCVRNLLNGDVGRLHRGTLAGVLRRLVQPLEIDL